MASPEAVYQETVSNFQVILLLMFMVAGIYFMRDMLLFVFTNILLKVKSKTTLSFLFCFAGAFLSAFLDALTVTAVLITISVGFYSVFPQGRIRQDKLSTMDHDHSTDEQQSAGQPP